MQMRTQARQELPPACQGPPLSLLAPQFFLCTNRDLTKCIDLIIKEDNLFYGAATGCKCWVARRWGGGHVLRAARPPYSQGHAVIFAPHAPTEGTYKFLTGLYYLDGPLLVRWSRAATSTN